MFEDDEELEEFMLSFFIFMLPVAVVLLTDWFW